jgi:tetratricopeptide (TPR) repeat protein
MNYIIKIFYFGIIGLFLMSLTGCVFKDTLQADILNNQGLQLLNKGDYSGARYYFQKSSQMKNIPAKRRAIYIRNIAIAYNQQHMIDSARFFFGTASALFPVDSYEYFTNMAEIYLIDKKIDKAVECLEKAININPHDLVANNSIGLLYMGEYDSSYYDPEVALKYNLNAYEFNPQRNTKFVLAKNYYALNDFSSAGRLMDELHKEYPNDIDLLISTIIVARKDGFVEKENRLMDELQKLDLNVYTKFKEELYYIN